MEAITQYRKPEQTFQRKEEELDLIFDKSAAAFYIMKLDVPIDWNRGAENEKLLIDAFYHQRITRVNQAFLNQRGASEDEIIGLSPADIFSVQVQSGKELLQELFDDGHSHKLTKSSKSNGDEFWSEGDYTVLYDDYGRITGHFSIQFDVTEKQLAQDQLTKSEQKFKGLFDHASDGIFISDQSGNLIEANPKAYETLGYEKNELLNMTIADVLDKDHLKKHPLAIDRLINGEELISQRIAKRKDNSTFDIEVSAKMMEDGNLLAIVRDISSRINTEKKLLEIQNSVEKKSHQLLLEKNLSDTILASLPGVFYLYNQEGKFLRWNNNFAKVTGYTDAEIAKMHPLNFFREEEKELLISKISNVFVAGEDSVEAPFLLKNGETIPFYFTGITIYYEGQTCLMGVGIDISEKVEAKKQLEKSNSQLKTAQEIAKTGYWEVDIQTQKIYWSDEMYNLLGVEEDCEPLTLMETYQLIHPEYHKAIKSKLHELNNKKEKVEHEFRATKYDGDPCWFKAVLTPTLNNEGEIVHMEGILQDISATKEGEKRLRISNERHELISKATNDGLWDWDIKANKITGNQQFFKLCEISPNPDMEIESEAFFSNIHPDDAIELRNMEQHIPGKPKNSIKRNFRFKSAKGDYKHFQDKVYIIYDKNEPVRMLGAIQDITEKVFADKKILQTIVNTQEKERFEIGRELHDNIMQLLVCAQMQLNQLANDSDGNSHVQLSKDFIKEGMNEIRKLSHQLAPSNVLKKSLEESIKSLLNTFNLESKYKINFQSKIDHTVIVQKDLLLNIYRIFQEQMNNINKHSKANEIDVALEINSDYIDLRLSDNGIGFKPGSVEKGIGLNNIQHRVDALEGTFRIDSKPDEGCVTAVQIPLS